MCYSQIYFGQKLFNWTMTFNWVRYFTGYTKTKVKETTQN